jgi:hypothetical protein
MNNINTNNRTNRIPKAALLTACMALLAIASAPVDGRAVNRTIIRTATHMATASFASHGSGQNVMSWWWLRRWL